MDKWILFKNYLHNELGISKEDIKEWIKDAVTEVAEKLVNQTFEKYPIEDIVRKQVEKIVLDHYHLYDKEFTREIKRLVVAEIIDNFKIEISNK